MPDDKVRRLEKTVAALQGRWGIRAIRRLGAPAPGGGRERPWPALSTGFVTLDDALGIGGLPQGRISEIVGIPTSGLATIAHKVIAQAQAQAGLAVYIDLDQTFDPDYAARCGVSLAQLVVARPHDDRQALAMLQDFVAGGGLSALVFDAPFRLLATPATAQALSARLGRLLAPLSRTAGVLLFLSSLPANSPPSLHHYPAQVTLPHYATVRLLLWREGWLYRRRDICGYQARVWVVKNKLGPADRPVRLAIMFDDAEPA